MRSIRWIGAGALAALLAGAAEGQTPRQFDLRCEGTRQMDLNGPRQPHSFSIRVDLDLNRWCWTACERTYEIADIGPERITFRDESEETVRRRSRVEAYVDRTTGEFRQNWIEVRPIPTYLDVMATCEPAPFSGFPAARF